MTEELIPLRDMYELTNPDPLRRHTIRSIAAAAGCSISTIHRLRTGKRTEVSEGIARGIAKACGVEFGEMFHRSGRVAWS